MVIVACTATRSTLPGNVNYHLQSFRPRTLSYSLARLLVFNRKKVKRSCLDHPTISTADYITDSRSDRVEDISNILALRTTESGLDSIFGFVV